MKPITKNQTTALIASLALLGSLILPVTSQANPVGLTGANVTGTTVNPTTYNISVASKNAIASASSFNIASTETTNIAGQNGGALAVNITNGAPTTLAGHLTSNIFVALFNRAGGIQKTSGAQLSAPAALLSASQLAPTNTAFLAGTGPLQVASGSFLSPTLSLGQVVNIPANNQVVLMTPNNFPPGVSVAGTTQVVSNTTAPTTGGAQVPSYLVTAAAGTSGISYNYAAGTATLSPTTTSQLASASHLYVPTSIPTNFTSYLSGAKPPSFMSTGSFSGVPTNMNFSGGSTSTAFNAAGAPGGVYFGAPPPGMQMPTGIQGFQPPAGMLPPAGMQGMTPPPVGGTFTMPNGTTVTRTGQNSFSTSTGMTGSVNNGTVTVTNKSGQTQSFSEGSLPGFLGGKPPGPSQAPNGAPSSTPAAGTDTSGSANSSQTGVTPPAGTQAPSGAPSSDQPQDKKDKTQNAPASAPSGSQTAPIAPSAPSNQ